MIASMYSEMHKCVHEWIKIGKKFKGFSRPLDHVTSVFYPYSHFCGSS